MQWPDSIVRVRTAKRKAKAKERNDEFANAITVDGGTDKMVPPHTGINDGEATFPALKSLLSMPQLAMKPY